MAFKDCNDCPYVNLTEREQNFLKYKFNIHVKHFCTKFCEQTFHDENDTSNRKDTIYPCKTCTDLIRQTIKPINANKNNHLLEMARQIILNGNVKVKNISVTESRTKPTKVMFELETKYFSLDEILERSDNNES